MTEVAQRGLPALIPNCIMHSLPTGWVADTRAVRVGTHSVQLTTYTLKANNPNDGPVEQVQSYHVNLNGVPLLMTPSEYRCKRFMTRLYRALVLFNSTYMGGHVSTLAESEKFFFDFFQRFQHAKGGFEYQEQAKIIAAAVRYT